LLAPAGAHHFVNVSGIRANLYLDVGGWPSSITTALPPHKMPAEPVERNLGGSQNCVRSSGIEKHLLHFQEMGSPSSSLISLLVQCPSP
jgi:hypothetical protein